MSAGLDGWLLSPPQLQPANSVLDVGCGIRPQRIIEADRYVGVDAHQPYIDALGPDFPGELICGDWTTVLAQFRRYEFDLVLALDFIEHLTKPDGHRFLREAERVGKQICIFTPLGEFPQHYMDGEPDQWGMDGGYWQTHRSAWSPDDLPDWTIRVLDGFHRVDAKGIPFPEPISAFWAVKGGPRGQ